MKRLMLYCLFIGLIGISFYPMSTKHTTSCNPITLDFVPEVISLSELTQETFSDFFKGKQPQLAIQCRKGKSLPFNIGLMGESFKLKTEEISNSIMALETFYIRCVENTCLFSTNLKDWYRFSEFFTIETRIGWDVQEETPKLRFILGLELAN